jgi:hypothetical protein
MMVSLMIGWGYAAESLQLATSLGLSMALSNFQQGASGVIPVFAALL